MKKTNKIQQLSKQNKSNERRAKFLGQIAEMLERKNIDLEDIGEIKKVSVFQNVAKDADGEIVVNELAAVSFSPTWEQGPEWPIIEQGPAVQLQKPTTKSKVVKDFKTCVIVPDIQIGYYRVKESSLEPTHDEAAIGVAIRMIEDLQPDLVACVGDNLDLPEMGKYLTYPAYQQTTQASIDRATMFCAQVRAAAPDAKIVWLAGNHEERMPKYIVANAVAAYGLRRGGAPDKWPVLSVPFLCRMDEHGVEYRPGYPASDLWINKKLRIIHGDKVRSSGSTAHMYLNSEKTSVIFGHIHRIEQAFKTREDYEGPRTIMAASPGCLARIDGAIPSTKGGVDLDGRPITRHENWQQGLGVVRYEDKGKHRFTYDNIPIYNGWAMYQGKEYAAD